MLVSGCEKNIRKIWTLELKVFAVSVLRTTFELLDWTLDESRAIGLKKPEDTDENNKVTEA